MIFIIEVIFSRVNTIRLIFHKGDTSRNNLVISIFVVFGCFLSDFLDSLYEPILISVGIVCNNPHSSIDFDHLLPVRHFAWPIKLNTLEFIRITILSLQLVASVFVEVADFSYS